MCRGVPFFESSRKWANKGRSPLVVLFSGKTFASIKKTKQAIFIAWVKRRFLLVLADLERDLHA